MLSLYARATGHDLWGGNFNPILLAFYGAIADFAILRGVQRARRQNCCSERLRARENIEIL